MKFLKKWVLEYPCVEYNSTLLIALENILNRYINFANFGFKHI